LAQVKEKGLRALTPDQVELLVESEGALVLDTRAAQTFKDGFVPRSINIGLKGDFAPWVGTLIPDVKHPLVLVADEGSEEEAVTRLARVGYDNVLGYLKGGMAAWKESRPRNGHHGEHFRRGVPPTRQQAQAAFYRRAQARRMGCRTPGGCRLHALQFLNDHLAEFSKDGAVLHPLRRRLP
jgi:rhodanese-related sulfurtransferase